MMDRLVLQKSFRVTGVIRGVHISCLTPDRVCISDRYNNLILTNTTGEDLHHLTDIDSGLFGIHTVNIDGDLIYIDREYNINKLSTVNKVKSTFIKYTAPWKPVSAYSSPSTGDLLVGMCRRITNTAKVTRYNSTGENIQTIQHDNTGQRLCSNPRYITENHNGDVIVSDLGRVVVTECGGRHRFSYTGPPSGSGLDPRGICTDALSHILVCDLKTNTVQMIDKDGHFLAQILTQQQGIDGPGGLSYDVRTQLLWVGSWWDNTVNRYKCIYGDSLTAGLSLENVKCKKHPTDPLSHYSVSETHRVGLSLENVKCKKHPKDPLSLFCIKCEVTLCEICISTSDDHKRHDVRDVEELFHEIHKRKDGDAVLMCLLLCPSYKINLQEENWIKIYNAVAEAFKFKKIKKQLNLSNLKKYKPILKQNSSEVTFSCEFFKHTSFLRFGKDPKFVDIFLAWAEKENIAEYCRSWAYPTKEGEEVFCWLPPQQTERLIEKLGDEIFKHPTWQDTSIHEAVFSNLGIPVQVIMRGDQSVKNFMENLKKGTTTMYHASGMIIGCAGSGKSTLLGRLKGINLKEILENTTSTRGIDIQSDIFDVTDTIRVNTSNQKQRFKVKIDEMGLQRNIPEHPAELSDGMNKLDIDESADKKGIASKAVDEKMVRDEEMSHENLNTETDSGSSSEAAALVEEEEEMVEEGQDVPENSEIKGILRVFKNLSDDPEKKITMVDFAGQCAYYASHQIFLSPRVFFILVLNMEKKFDDKVGKEVCSQEGSIYEGWTHRDYLIFWAKSIHQYSHKKAPVLLVCTHAEEKTEQEKRNFFREIWKTLETKNKSLKGHLDKTRVFAVGFHESECIEKIKKSIVDVVQQLDHWGEKLPHSWAMFENFFQEKKSLKIIKKEALLAFNEALPQEIKLETDEDIKTMLQFFHDIREILNFDQELLSEVIFLDVQWFADAFKNVITDKNHAEEDLLEHATEWDKFDDTGELSDTLLSAIWKMNKNEYLEHKDDIMRYMEKLGLLAKMEDKKWYVPCMNKRQFPANAFSAYPSASSILCYTFDILPAGIFHRLIAKCVQIPWSFFLDKDQPCIYQTAAVFIVQDHNILLGMTPTEIQLQVFVIKGEVNISTCYQIKETINSILNILSKTFHTDSTFCIAFKCKATGFCNSQESSVINESEFTRPTLQCPSCPKEGKHIINTKDIIKYWNQAPDGESELPEAKDNPDKILKLLQVGTDAVRICFDKFFPKEDLQKTLKANESDMRRGTYRFQPPQLEILFPTQGGSNTDVSSLSMDITIMYKLLRNFSDIAPPGNGWGKTPEIVHISESDDIERIRLYRNKYFHATESNRVISDNVFKIIWNDISEAIIRLSGGVLKRRISEI